jgi:hypothetical protein
MQTGVASGDQCRRIIDYRKDSQMAISGLAMLPLLMVDNSVQRF